ncbi:MAG TPA: hypothetical protein VJN92_21145 [Candidatus Acidoferrum sp.]|nr:hypothetical protein [Candidatus Acidoferrum sp.]
MTTTLALPEMPSAEALTTMVPGLPGATTVAVVPLSMIVPADTDHINALRQASRILQVIAALQVVLSLVWTEAGEQLTKMAVTRGDGGGVWNCADEP